MYFGQTSYFLTVVETRNITKAAQILHISQPSLTQYLNRLENSLGVKLLDRSKSPLNLTDAGNIYLEYVQDITRAEDRLHEQLKHYKESQEKSLSIGIPSQMFSSFFEKVIRNFLIEHPEVNLTLKEGTSLTLPRSLIKNEIDIGFFHATEKGDPRFTRYILEEESPLLICERNGELANMRDSSIEEPIELTTEDIPKLRSACFVMLSKEYFLTEIALSCFREFGVPPLKSVEIANVESIMNYIAMPGSNGVTVLTKSIITCNEIPDNLAFFKMNWNFKHLYLCMNYLTEVPLLKAGIIFWEDVVRRFSQKQK